MFIEILKVNYKFTTPIIIYQPLLRIDFTIFSSVFLLIVLIVMPIMAWINNLDIGPYGQAMKAYEFEQFSWIPLLFMLANIESCWFYLFFPLMSSSSWILYCYIVYPDCDQMFIFFTFLSSILKLCQQNRIARKKKTKFHIV